MYTLDKVKLDIISENKELHAHHQLIHALVTEVRNLREQLHNIEITHDWQTWYSSSDRATAAYHPKLVVEYMLNQDF